MGSCRFLQAVFVFLLSSAALSSQSPVRKQTSGAEKPTDIPPPLQRILYSITAANLKGDLSFLASDALQGRYTPSPGLEVAAEFIASQFRAAGLDPGGDQEYFQTAIMIDRHLPKAQSDLVIKGESRTITIPPNTIAVYDANQAQKIDHAAVVMFPSRDPDLLKDADLSGKAVVAPVQPSSRTPRDQMADLFRKARAFDKAVAGSNAAIEILVGQQRPNNDRLMSEREAQEHHVPVLAVASDELQKWLDQPETASEHRTVSVEIPVPDDRRVVLRNVVGILRGSDPRLKDTCVLLSAHYDHIGTTETAGRAALNRSQNPNDHIYNGANDDGSGTVSVVEIAKSLAKLRPHPKRSLVFVAFFGEERGELGSQHYGKYPAFPLVKTVADVNLEQVGRTDSTMGPQVNKASLTGFDYSDVTKFLAAAGRETGVTVYMDRQASDAYFTRSDNAALAEQGVPAHSLTVAFDFPDYHGLGDEWQKIDYENMARVDRMIALGLVNIANSLKPPEWNAQNTKTAPFRQAQQNLHRP
jgi:Peptidase family M28